MAARGLFCCVWAFSTCGERGLLSSCGVRAASGGSFSLQSMGFGAHRLNCPKACGIFSDWGSNPCSLHSKAES